MAFPMLNSIGDSGSDPERIAKFLGALIEFDALHLPTKCQFDLLSFVEVMIF